jgi:hypothetical protein
LDIGKGKKLEHGIEEKKKERKGKIMKRRKRILNERSNCKKETII